FPANPICLNNYVQIGNGEEVNRYEKKHCQFSGPVKFLSDSNLMHIKIGANSLPRSAVIKFIAKELSPKQQLQCKSEVMANVSGTEVLLPGDNKFIPAGYRCTYRVQVPKESQIKLNFSKFEVR
ncbi:hypothetical protein FGIG_06563, partial [Fasciola gigantica]